MTIVAMQFRMFAGVLSVEWWREPVARRCWRDADSGWRFGGRHLGIRYYPRRGYLRMWEDAKTRRPRLWEHGSG